MFLAYAQLVVYYKHQSVGPFALMYMWPAAAVHARTSRQYTSGLPCVLHRLEYQHISLVTVMTGVSHES